MTSLKVGGEAAWFAAPDTVECLVAALEWARANGIQLRVLGGGSNVLIADTGLEALVIHPRATQIQVTRDGGDVVVDADAGVSWDALVSRCVAAGWAGIECLAGIPGFVGAAPIQNIGAYGQEVSEVVESVRVWDPDAEGVVRMAPVDCGFAYRSSVFKRSPKSGRIVLGLTLRLRDGGAATIRYAELARRVAAEAGIAPVREAVLALRRGKSMVLDPADPNSRSAGSFFMNPILDATQVDAVEAAVERMGVAASTMPRWRQGAEQTKLAAAWLIERAGLSKGFCLGRAGLSARHTLAIINRGDALASEIVELAAHVRETVRARFGVVLVPEPVFMGFGRPTADLLDETTRLGRMPAPSR